MRSVRLHIAAALAAALVPTAVLPAQQVVTGPPSGSWINSNGFGQLNTSQAILVGQTFVAPQYTQLDRFQFHLGDSRSFAMLGYRAFVAAFDEATDRIVGPMLFQSALQNGTSATVPTPTTFETGGIGVTPGQLYIAFLGAPEIAGSSSQLFGAAYRTETDAYAAGAAKVAVAYNGTVPSIHDATFTPLANDLAFTASFSTPAASTVPEPATVTLLAGGLLGVAGAARRRRARG